jgi:predicted TIM-barrel fold metal-dependent hydrolase
MASTTTADRQIVISADGHAGADLLDYRPYLERRWHDDFDAWAAAYVNPFSDLVTKDATRNWDNEKRQRELESNGVVAEVLFPNTIPPFFDRGSLIMNIPSAEDYERKWAGLRAHNRWLVDFCAAVPGRRAGIAQILLNDVDDACEEIRWVKEVGLTGGILVPGVPPGVTQVPQLSSPTYNEIWATCAALGIPINSHGGGGSPGFSFDAPSDRAVGLLEVTYYSHRTLWHLIYNGAFERHPELKLVLTEQGTGWVPRTLATLDEFYNRFTTPGAVEHAIAGGIAEVLHRPPSEYFETNCYVTASSVRPIELTVRDEMGGAGRIMWGADYPHLEGSHPHTTEALRFAFAGIPADEVHRMLAEVPAEVYGFDLDQLQRVADEVGPTVAELGEPLGAVPADSSCNTFEPRATIKAW